MFFRKMWLARFMIFERARSANLRFYPESIQPRIDRKARAAGERLTLSGA